MGQKRPKVGVSILQHLFISTDALETKLVIQLKARPCARPSRHRFQAVKPVEAASPLKGLCLAKPRFIKRDGELHSNHSLKNSTVCTLAKYKY